MAVITIPYHSDIKIVSQCKFSTFAAIGLCVIRVIWILSTTLTLSWIQEEEEIPLHAKMRMRNKGK